MNGPYATGAGCLLLPDAEYVDCLRQTIQSAERRCLCTMFIIDLLARCSTNCVSDVVDDLSEAHWRGVDVRVLIGGSRSTFAIAEAAAVAHAHLGSRGVACRWLTSDRGVRGSHSKIVVVDDAVLLGSHNWSPGSFHRETQDSLRLSSPALAEYFAEAFERRWHEPRSTTNG